ncbi:Glycosyl transferase family 2 [Tropicimonas sediminicola]|uniref:Glycosyl transferase family 2 n=2 Tax=Tropicimonas sediminicola TaxID=1031541 RepID=A0A239JFY6_9RHOB|nr:Glycosyl transferase family 2 [Tropicimonas sediminicola]
MVSIIVPVYNVAGYVGACLDSLMRQTFEDFEVIVVDDGSTDDSLIAVWNAIGLDPRFHVVTRPNGGLSAARNTGLRIARGAYIGFIDSDDRIAPSYLANLLGALVETGAYWAACGVRFCLANGTAFDHPAIHGRTHPAVDHPGPAIFRLDDWTDVIPHFPSAWNKLYRRELIAGMEFVEGIYYEDHPFFYECARRTDRLAYVPEPLYWQTQGREGQITRESSERVFEQFDVLELIDRTMAASQRPGRERAMARIATRLVFERSLAISDPDLRARFAEAGRRYFERRGLTYAPDWDRDISRLWGLLISGELPLGIVMRAEEPDERLARTLASLARSPFRDFETILLYTDDPEDEGARHAALLAATAETDRCTVLRHAPDAALPALEQAAAATDAVFLLFLTAGDTLPEDKSLRDTLEWMVRKEADLWAPPPETQAGAFPYPVFRRAYLCDATAGWS